MEDIGPKDVFGGNNGIEERERKREKVDELEGLFVSICLFVLVCLRESEIVKVGGGPGSKVYSRTSSCHLFL